MTLIAYLVRVTDLAKIVGEYLVVTLHSRPTKNRKIVERKAMAVVATPVAAACLLVLRILQYQTEAKDWEEICALIPAAIPVGSWNLDLP